MSKSAEAQLKAPVFSHGEALQIATLTADTLLTWHKRGLVPESAVRPAGRGHRRRYSYWDVLYLSLFKRVAGSGLPLASARFLTNRLIPLVAMILVRASAQGPLPESGPSYLLALWEDRSAKPKFNLFSPQNPVPREGIEGWMRSEQLDSLTIIDLTAWGVAFRKRMATVFRTNPDAASSFQAVTEAGQSEVGGAI